MTRIEIRRRGAGPEAVRRFAVEVDGHSYDVGVSDSDAQRIAPGVPAEELVRESFRFLLEHEPPGSIMRRFDLPVISRYFPEYERDMERRFRR